MAQELKVTREVMGDDYISAMTLYIVTNGAAELLLRAAESMVLRKGCEFKHEQKQLYKNLMEATRKVCYYYNQLTESGTLASTNTNQEAASLFDGQLYDANLAVVLLMRTLNAVDGNRKAQLKLIQQLRTNGKDNKVFSEVLINKFEDKLKLMNHEKEITN